jgi:hypothetical protein
MGPAIFTYRQFVREGALIAYGPDTTDIFQRSASYIDRILKGANPGDLPVQAPNKFELAINIRTARLCVTQRRLGDRDRWPCAPSSKLNWGRSLLAWTHSASCWDMTRISRLVGEVFAFTNLILQDRNSPRVCAFQNS